MRIYQTTKDQECSRSHSRNPIGYGSCQRFHCSDKCRVSILTTTFLLHVVFCRACCPLTVPTRIHTPGNTDCSPCGLDPLPQIKPLLHSRNQTDSLVGGNSLQHPSALFQNPSASLQYPSISITTPVSFDTISLSTPSSGYTHRRLRHAFL